MSNTDSNAATELNGQTVLVPERGSDHAVIELLETHGYTVQKDEFTTDEKTDSETLKGYLVQLEN